jgi:hypothetical protein
MTTFFKNLLNLIPVVKIKLKNQQIISIKYEY